METSLKEVVDQELIKNLPASLKETIDLALTKGVTKAQVLVFAKKSLGYRGLTLLAIEAYLGADQQGRVKND